MKKYYFEGPIFKFWGGPGSRVTGPTFTPCRQLSHHTDLNVDEVTPKAAILHIGVNDVIHNYSQSNIALQPQ